MKNIFTGLILSTLLSATAQASFIGDTLGASLETDLTFPTTITQQFTSLAIVGAGSEFKGRFSNPFTDPVNVVLDVDADQFTISFAGDDFPFGPSALILFDKSLSLLHVHLFDLDWNGVGGKILSVTDITHYTCAPQDFCDVGQGSDRSQISHLGFTDNSIDVSFNSIYTNTLYTFKINANTTQVPEPSTALLLSLGLFGLCALRFRKA